MSNFSVGGQSFVFSITITKRCNSSCEYCHFFASKKNRGGILDMDEQMFLDYLDFIKFWKTNVSEKTSFRFSGGEPLILGDKLIELADVGYQKTGIRPFVLTAGKNIERKWIEKARSSAMEYIFVSVENPFAPAKGAPDPKKTTDLIKELSTPLLPVFPGVCVISNSMFKELSGICNWFYEKIGSVPTISEINYDAYVSPNDDQFVELKREVEKTLVTFSKKIPLNLFPSVFPELAYGGRKHCIFELDIANGFEIGKNHNYDLIAKNMLNLAKKRYFPKLRCRNTQCPWFQSCLVVKRNWMYDENRINKNKLEDFCKFKRLLSDTYYRIFVDPTHKDTECSIQLAY
jgi:hypothetical protein